MTTIAWKDGILASDTRATVRGRVWSDNYPKIFNVEGGGYTLCGEEVLAYGTAGFVYSQLSVGSILEQGVQVGSTLDTDDDFQTIVITKNGAYAMSKEDDNPNLRIIKIPDDVHWAIGSGADVAGYVMLTGGGAVEAVVAACKVDTGSGGEVDVWQR